MPSTVVFHIVVEPVDAGTRLDLMVASRVGALTRSQAAGLIQQGKITVNGLFKKPGYRLQVKDEVTGRIPPPANTVVEPEPLALDILHEDDDVIVLNKPAGVVVHPSPGHASGTLVNALLHHCNDLSGVGCELRPGIVHRLDKDTSGVMVATKDDRTHRYLARQFKAHSIQRRYRALVHGLIAEATGTIDQPIGRHPVHRKKMSTAARSSRRAVTRWQVLRRYEDDRMTLVDLSLETGRTHQIRVHLAHVGFPIVGDDKYGDFELNRRVARGEFGVPFGRMFLHAWATRFRHPVSGVPMSIESALDRECSDFLRGLGSA